MPEIETYPYDEFGPALLHTVTARRIPVQGSLELTSRCNLDCAHCYINRPATDAQSLSEELETSEVIRILDEVAEEGCLWLLLTGGEPLLREDFEEIYLHAKKSGFLISLFTNGTLVTDRVADLLAKWRPRSIEVTMYGATPKTYESVTRRPGSYDRCMQGIQRLLERGLPLQLKSMVMTLNRHEIILLHRLAESLGVKFRFDPMLNCRVDGGPGPERFRLSPEKTVEVDLAFEERRIEWERLCERFPYSMANTARLFNCGAGGNSFHVTAEGRLCVCLLYRVQNYDLRKGAFTDGWRDVFPTILNQKQNRRTKCTECELMVMCGQCPGWALLEHGDPEAPVEYLCRIAHLRAQGLDLRRKNVKQA